MSGHSKWSQIKNKKGLSDQKRGQLFSKLSKKLSLAVKDGADPSTNYRLQAVIDEAKSVNMPKDNIERAIKKAGDKGTASLKELTIQVMGPGSVAIVIEAITDNANRTLGEIKTILNKNEVKMAEEGSLDWMFSKKGVIKASFPKDGIKTGLPYQLSDNDKETSAKKNNDKESMKPKMRLLHLRKKSVIPGRKKNLNIFVNGEA